MSAGFAIAWPGDPRYLEYRERFAAESDRELVDSFNSQVGNNRWVRRRDLFLLALHEEFEKRGFDYSAIGNANGLTLEDKVNLVGKKIEVLAD